MSDIDPGILQTCESYRRAIYEKDVEAFLGLYDPQARVFDTWGVWSYENVGERRKVVEEWFSCLGGERVRVTIDRLRSVAAKPTASLTARVVYTAVSSSGDELRAMQNRLTWVLQAQGGAWKIVHEHTSVPIGFNDLKGILPRD